MNEGEIACNNICYKSLARNVLIEAAKEFQNEKKCNMFNSLFTKFCIRLF